MIIDVFVKIWKKEIVEITSGSRDKGFFVNSAFTMKCGALGKNQLF